MRRHPLPVLILLVWLAGCEPFPDLGPANSASGARPDLLSVAELQALQAGASTAEAETRIMALRVARLRARAAALRAPVLSLADRRSLERAMAG